MQYEPIRRSPLLQLEERIEKIRGHLYDKDNLAERVHTGKVTRTDEDVLGHVFKIYHGLLPPKAYSRAERFHYQYDQMSGATEEKRKTFLRGLHAFLEEVIQGVKERRAYWLHVLEHRHLPEEVVPEHHAALLGDALYWRLRLATLKLRWFASNLSNKITFQDPQGKRLLSQLVAQKVITPSQRREYADYARKVAAQEGVSPPTYMQYLSRRLGIHGDEFRITEQWNVPHVEAIAGEKLSKLLKLKKRRSRAAAQRQGKT